MKSKIRKILQDSGPMCPAEMAEAMGHPKDALYRNRVLKAMRTMPDVIRMEGGRYKLSLFINPDGSYGQEALKTVSVRRDSEGQKKYYGSSRPK